MRSSALRCPSCKASLFRDGSTELRLGRQGYARQARTWSRLLLLEMGLRRRHMLHLGARFPHGPELNARKQPFVFEPE